MPEAPIAEEPFLASFEVVYNSIWQALTMSIRIARNLLQNKFNLIQTNLKFSPAK